MIRTKVFEKKWNVRVLLLPVLILSQILGVTIYYGRKNKYYTHLYRLFILSLLILSLIHEVPSMRYWQENSRGLHRVIVKLETYTWWFSCFFNFLVTVYKNNKINDVIERLDRTNVFMSRKTQSHILRFHILHLAFNVLFIVAHNVIGHDIVWPNPNHTFFTSTLYIFGDIMVLVCFYEFLHLVNVIGDIFRQINSKFKSIIRGGKSDFTSSVSFHNTEIIRLRQSHLFLTQTCTILNSCFVDQLLFIIMFSMVEGIYAIRSIVGDFFIPDVKESALNVLSDAVWLIPYFITLIHLIMFCEKTSMEAKKTVFIVHHLMNIYYYDSDILRELELFANQIQQHPITFHVRFFELHYAFLNTLVSSLMTYFVLIATFQGESENGVFINWGFNPPPSTLAPQ